MATKSSNTTPARKSELEREQQLEVKRLQIAQRELAKTYKAEEKVEVTISPMYQPHFGKQMPVIINGIPIYVPCNGKAYKIPKSYARVVRQRIRHVDDQLQRSRRLSNVAENFEAYAGSKEFISKA